MRVTAEAYSFESRFVLKEIEGWFPPGAEITRQKTLIELRYSATKVAFAYDFGAVVFFGAERAACDKTIARFMKELPREPHPPLREDFLVEQTDGAPMDVLFDHVVVPNLSAPVLEVIATVLAQSTTIDYYDEDIGEIMARIGEIARQVAKDGKPRGRTKDLIRFVGAATASQVEIVAAIALLDKPDISWENELADRLHDKMRSHFEIPERHRALESKLVTIREALGSFLDLAQERRMLLLEIAVVLLILIELVLGFVRLH